jgi:hypothetical protein
MLRLFSLFPQKVSLNNTCVDLIKFSLQNDIWFHADNLSSAHVYLRHQQQDWRSIPSDLLNDVAQLTKANSIQGNKKNNITIIYVRNIICYWPTQGPYNNSAIMTLSELDP